MVVEKAKAIKVFFCYAEEDKALREEIEKHLSLVRRLRQLTGWFYRDILAGTDWVHEIEKRIDEASLILLLVSPDFIYSDYCYSVEMLRAIERHRTGRACVIPIILRPVFWEETIIGELQVLPMNRKPITQWLDRDTALLEVAHEISKVVRMLLSKELLSTQETKIIDRLAGSGKSQSVILHNQKQPLSITSALPEVRPLEALRASYLNPEEKDTTDLLYGKIINGRYLVQRLIKKGSTCFVYQGIDQVLQRVVTVKAVPAPHVPIYRAALRLTASLSHPNIIGLYDFVIEPEMLYVVQEFIEGDDFVALLQLPLMPHEVV